jgi:predicted esterase
MTITQDATYNACATQVITINATVAGGFGNGGMIVALFRVTADQMEDVINRQDITVIRN